MAGVGIRLTHDDAMVRRALAQLQAAGKDLVRPLDEIGQRMVTKTVRRFEDETGADGAPWAPSRRAAEEGGQTLTDRARLRNSIQHVVTGDEVAWGTNVVYGAIHQLGSDPDGSLPRGIPERPYLGVDDEDRDVVLEVFSDHLTGSP